MLASILKLEVECTTMPSTKNNKSRTRPSVRSTQSNTVSPAIEFEMKKWDGGDSLRRPPGEQTGNPSPDPGFTCDEMGEEEALTFLTLYQLLEQALVRAGFTRPGRTPGCARADWTGFARHMEGRSDPELDVVMQAAIAHLLWQPDLLALRNERLENADRWENVDPDNDSDWLAELLQRTHNQLIQAINFPKVPACDPVTLSAALVVLERWAHLDPGVESLLTSGL